MSERDGFEHGVPCWVDTWQPDAEAAVAFYSRLFGWDFEDTMPADVPGHHFMCRLRGRDVAAIASRPQAASPLPAWNTYVWVDDAAEAASKAGAAGGSVLMEAFASLDGVASRSSPIPQARQSAFGSRGRIGASSSSTSRAPGR
jgi:predicted enzyme related to lactoylglutathione lyase